MWFDKERAAISRWGSKANAKMVEFRLVRWTIGHSVGIVLETVHDVGLGADPDLYRGSYLGVAG
jgi:hypothetical protein